MSSKNKVNVFICISGPFSYTSRMVVLGVGGGIPCFFKVFKKCPFIDAHPKGQPMSFPGAHIFSIKDDMTSPPNVSSSVLGPGGMPLVIFQFVLQQHVL